MFLKIPFNLYWFSLNWGWGSTMLVSPKHKWYNRWAKTSSICPSLPTCLPTHTSPGSQTHTANATWKSYKAQKTECLQNLICPFGQPSILPLFAVAVNDISILPGPKTHPKLFSSLSLTPHIQDHGPICPQPSLCWTELRQVLPDYRPWPPFSLNIFFRKCIVNSFSIPLRSVYKAL